MTAKDYLKQARLIQKRIEQKELLLRELREKAIDGNKTADGGGGSSSTKKGSRIEFLVSKYIDLEEEIKEDVYELYKKRNEIIDTIHRLEDSRYIMILYAHWIDGESFEQIAVSMNYNFYYVRRLYTKAMGQIQQAINEMGES